MLFKVKTNKEKFQPILNYFIGKGLEYNKRTDTYQTNTPLVFVINTLMANLGKLGASVTTEELDESFVLLDEPVNYFIYDSNVKTIPTKNCRRLEKMDDDPDSEGGYIMEPFNLVKPKHPDTGEELNDGEPQKEFFTITEIYNQYKSVVG